MKRFKSLVASLKGEFYSCSHDELFAEFKEFKYTVKDRKFQAKIETGEDAILFSKILTKRYPKMKVKICLTYELMRGGPFSVSRDKIYRNVSIQNVSEAVSQNVEDSVTSKGEIYRPDNPLLVSYVYVKAWVSELMSSPVGTRGPTLGVFKSSYQVVYRAAPVRNVYEAVFYEARRRHMKRQERKVFPAKARKAGVNSSAELEKLDIYKQIDILSRSGRKSSLFSKGIKYVHPSDTQYLKDADFCETVVVTYDKCLKVLCKAKISGLDYKGRDIKERKLESLKDSIIVTYDTEWNWVEQTEGSMVVNEPDFLACTTIFGSRWCEKSNEYQYEKHTKHFLVNPVLKFISYLTSLSEKYKSKKIYCVAHNASKIENILVINALTKKYAAEYDNYELKFRHVTGTSVHSFVWKGITFIDSNKFFQGSLDSVTKSLNKRYFKKELTKEEILNENWKNPSEKGLKYAIMDSVALAEMWMRGNQMLNEVLCSKSDTYKYGYVNFSSFKSGSSVVKWFLTKDSAVVDREDAVDKGASTSTLKWDSSDAISLREVVFHGGRSECYFIGTSEDFKKSTEAVKLSSKSSWFSFDAACNLAYAIKIDRTSSYPAEMTFKAMPGLVCGTYNMGSLKELDMFLASNTGGKQKINFIYSCLKFKNELKLPLLAYKSNNKLMFPNFMTGDVCVPMWDFEYESIKDNIEDATQIEVISFEKSREICPKIKKLYDMREEALAEGDSSKSFIIKILMNSGYGSMALNPDRETAYLAKGKKIEQISSKYSELTTMDGPNGFTWIITKNREEVNSLVFTASYITASARHELWKEGMKLINEEGAVLLMCDTDSHMFVDRFNKLEHYTNMYKGGELGSWKLEGMSDSWEIAALKVYRFGKEVKFKGVSAPASSMIKNGKIVKEIEMEVWGKGRDGKLSVTKTTKRMSFEYDKGITSLDGTGFVSPLVY